VRVVDEAGVNLGVMNISEAIALAQSKGLDLVEIAPNANPPVVKIISFDKFRYQREKERKKHAHKQAGKLKQVQITPRSADNDLMTKAKQVKKFLEEGNKVEIAMFLKGRERFNQEWAKKRFSDFMEMIDIDYQITMPIKSGGKGLITQIVKGK
jgi:translation initiation factor IF-3